MKLLIVFVAVCIGLVASEGCSSPSDCQWEHCGDGWVVGCHAGTCTCDDPNHQTTECHGFGTADCANHHCQNNHQAVCVLGHCRCSFGGFLNGGIGK